MHFATVSAMTGKTNYCVSYSLFYILLFEMLMQIKIPPNYGRIYTQAFESIYNEIADELGILLVPFMLENIALDSNLMLPDGIHPNEKGQPFIAEEVYKWLEPF